MTITVPSYYEQNRDRILKHNAAWRERNIEKVKVRNAQHYQENKERLSASMKQYYNDNKEAMNAQSKAYYHAHKDKTLESDRERSRRWYQENKDKVIAKASRRKRVKENQRCTCCSDSVFTRIYKFARIAGLHVDHIRPLSKKGAHCQLNLQLLSPKANLSKDDNWDGKSGVGLL